MSLAAVTSFRQDDPFDGRERDSSRYFDRELSWLAFNRRVLEEACNGAHPLLERLRFLSIAGSNLDEFFMVRVAGLMRQRQEEVEARVADAPAVSRHLAEVIAQADRLMESQQAVWRDLRPLLAASGIAVLDRGGIAEPDEAVLAAYFREQLFPVLTPQAIDPSHPFPFIPNKGLSVMFDLERLADREPVREVVMLPATMPRFVRLAGEQARYVAVEVVLSHFAALLFPGYRVERSATFRVLRDSDLEIEEEAEDLVRYFANAIKRRRRGRVIRLELETATPEELARPLREELGGVAAAGAGGAGAAAGAGPGTGAAGGAMVTDSGDFLGLDDLALLVEEDRPDLKFPIFTPRFPERIREFGGDCLAAIRAKDIVVHHPYETFDVVLAFLKQAAADPDVVAIKQTLYRAGKQPSVINALIAAAEAGKSVTAVVELKARFDEEQNIRWASALERAGVRVVYGFFEWKTHAKVSLVVRREGTAFRTYCHFGTGNYHPVTARIYTDLSFFTADPAIGADAAQMFNYVTGYIEPVALKRLVLSPRDLRPTLVELIDAEIAAAREGRPAGMWAKMNSLVDHAIIDKLYEASAAGVEINLIVRGICCLKPGVPGLSERIRVKSVVGRFLEHSRIYAFANGRPLPSDGARVFISSADWMQRNFDRRVEYMLPIENSTVHDQILDQVMVANLLDTEQSWALEPDGDYRRVAPGERPFNLHRYFMNNPSLSGRGAALENSGAVPTLSLRPPR